MIPCQHYGSERTSVTYHMCVGLLLLLSDKLETLEKQLREALEETDSKVGKLEKELKEIEEKLALRSVTAEKIYQAADWINNLLGRLSKNWTSLCSVLKNHRVRRKSSPWKI